MSATRQSKGRGAGAVVSPKGYNTRKGAVSMKLPSTGGSVPTPSSRTQRPLEYSKSATTESLFDDSSDLTSLSSSDESPILPHRRRPSHQDFDRLRREATGLMSLGHKVASKPFDFFQIPQSWDTGASHPEDVRSKFETIGQTTAFLIGSTAADAGISLETAWELANILPSAASDTGPKPRPKIPNRPKTLKDQARTEASACLLHVQETSAPGYPKQPPQDVFQWKSILHLCMTSACVLGGWPYPEIYPSSEYKTKRNEYRASYLKDLNLKGGQAIVKKFHKDRDTRDGAPDRLQLRFYRVDDLYVTSSGHLVPSSSNTEHATDIRPLKEYSPESRPLLADPDGRIIILAKEFDEHRRVVGRAQNVLASSQGQGDEDLPSYARVTGCPPLYFPVVKSNRSNPQKRRMLTSGKEKRRRGLTSDDEYEDKDKDD